MKQYFIGIDIGTSAAKTLLMDEHGVVTAQVSREYPLYQPANGWAEQDPEDWRNAVFSAVRELMERSQAEPEPRHTHELFSFLFFKISCF